MKPILLNEKEKELLKLNLIADLALVNEAKEQFEESNSRPTGKRWLNKWQRPLITSMEKIENDVADFSEREKFMMLASIKHYPEAAKLDTTDLLMKLGDKNLIEHKKYWARVQKYYSNYKSPAGY